MHFRCRESSVIFTRFDYCNAVLGCPIVINSLSSSESRLYKIQIGLLTFSKAKLLPHKAFSYMYSYRPMGVQSVLYYFCRHMAVVVLLFQSNDFTSILRVLTAIRSLHVQAIICNFGILLFILEFCLRLMLALLTLRFSFL